MGSGETSPTMTKVHRDLFARTRPGPAEAVLLDTPFGFQENADEISARAVGYFRESAGHQVEVASYRNEDEVGSLAYETTMARLRAARWVFSGPGSPSYALHHWLASDVPAALAHKLERGGCLIFASAAAATLGPVALPVYEIYKVGAAPHWLPGLDLMTPLGIPAAVVPHFDNAEGGHHDTRYCYMGERRLRALETQLPEGAFVLGIDEHTAFILDLDASNVTVAGLGGVTVRVQGRSSVIESGRTVSLACLLELAARAGDTAGAAEPVVAAAPPPVAPPASPQAGSVLRVEVDRIEAEFDAALAARDGAGAVACVLDLDTLLADWSSDTLQSDDMRHGRAALRAMIVRLGEAARSGLRDPRQVVGPFVETLLDARDRARAERRWADADAIRDRLVAAGIEVHDTPAGTAWDLTEPG